MKKKTLLSLVSLGAVALIGATALVGCNANNGGTTTNNSSVSSTVSNVTNQTVDGILGEAIAKMNEIPTYHAEIKKVVDFQMIFGEEKMPFGTKTTYNADIVNNSTNEANYKVLVDDVASSMGESTSYKREVIKADDSGAIYVGTQNEETGAMSYVSMQATDFDNEDGKLATFNVDSLADVASSIVEDGTENVDGIDYIKLTGNIKGGDIKKLSIYNSLGIDEYLEQIDTESLNETVEVTILLESDTKRVHSISLDATKVINEGIQKSTEQIDDTLDVGVAVTFDNAKLLATYAYDFDGLVIEAPKDAVKEIVTEIVEIDENEATDEMVEEVAE